MSEQQQGPDWWMASDGKWYPPQPAPQGQPPAMGQPGYPGQTPFGGAAPYPQVATGNSNATISLVLGIVSIVLCLGFLAGVPAIILGGKAKKEIAASGGAQGGDGMATAGQVTGWIGTVFSVLGLLAFVALFFIGSSAESDYNTDPSNGVCNPDRFIQDPDC